MPLTRWTFVGKVISLLFNMLSLNCIFLLTHSIEPLFVCIFAFVDLFWGGVTIFSGILPVNKMDCLDFIIEF